MPTEGVARRIQDVLRNIALIETYSAGLTKAEFADRQMVMDAVERCLERIAEAARKLGDRFDAEMPEPVDLHAIRQFGRVLRHDYDAIDANVIWNVVALDLPALKAAFRALQKEHPPPERSPDPDFDPF